MITVEKRMSNVAWQGEVVLAEAKWTDKDGHMVKFKLADADKSGANPFKGFTKRRANRAGTRFSASIVEIKRPDHFAYQGELMLAGWGDTSTQGHTVVFWIEPPMGARMHPFEGYQRDSDAFMAVLTELGDDDEAIDQAARAKVEKPAARGRGPQRLSQVAALLCSNPDFRDWIQMTQEVPESNNPLDTAQWVRDRLSVESRRSLDEDEGVAQMFHDEIRRPFAEYMESRRGNPF